MPTPESEEADQPYYPLFPINGRKPKHNPHQPGLPGLDDDCPPAAEPEPAPAPIQNPEPEIDPLEQKRKDERDCINANPGSLGDSWGQKQRRAIEKCMYDKGYKDYRMGPW